jgi:collagen type IV alpha-3-binding protein
LQEGPHSTIPEDEFFDAVETGLDKIEEDRQLRVRLKLQSQQSQISTTNDCNDDEHCKQSDDFGTGKLAMNHRLWPDIDKICLEQLHYARQGVGEGGNGWQLFADEGEMKMYRREEEVDGMVIDPLKSCHVVKGVTAREMCHYFFSPEYRNDWESKTILSQFVCCISNISIFSLSHAGRHANIGQYITRHVSFSANAQTDMAG